jgi:hypothetical protein
MSSAYDVIQFVTIEQAAVSTEQFAWSVHILVSCNFATEGLLFSQQILSIIEWSLPLIR